MSEDFCREFKVKLAISTDFIYQFIYNNYNFSETVIENILTIVDDVNCYKSVAGDDIDVLITELYNSEYIEYIKVVQGIYFEIIKNALSISPKNDIIITHESLVDNEFITFNHIDCMVTIQFLSKESLNLFKICKPESYQRLIEFEKALKEYYIRKKNRIPNNQKT